MAKSKSGVVWRNGCLILALASSTAFAQAPSGTAATGVRAEATRLMQDAETKLTRLADAIPADKYSWRPSKGVRSVSEVLLHVAAGNFSIPRRVGTEPPPDFKAPGYDTSTSDKAKVLETVKQSFAHAKQAAAKLTDADMEKTSPWFDGRQATYREILFFLAAHQHEHLGQEIAYARMIGVTPPWTEEQQRQKPQTKN